MTMNYTTTMRFIELMRGMPGLWDRNHRDYLNKDVRNQMKVNLSKKVGLSAEEVSKKIQNLRTYFVKECQKRDKAQLEGHTYEPKWPYFEALSQFWPIPTKRPLEFETAFSVSYSEDGTSNSEQQEADADEHTDNSCKRFVLEDPEFVDDNFNEMGDVASTSPPLKRIKTEFPAEPRSSDCASSLAEFRGTGVNGAPARAVPVTLNPAAPRPNTCLLPSTPVEDEDVLFGRYIVKELKLIKSFRIKQLTKLKVQQAVILAQLEAEDLSVSATHSVKQSPTSAS